MEQSPAGKVGDTAWYPYPPPVRWCDVETCAEQALTLPETGVWKVSHKESPVTSMLNLSFENKITLAEVLFEDLIE